MPIRVQGHCPFGCGETLYLTDDGRVRCDPRLAALWDEEGQATWEPPACPRPDAVHEFLMDPEPWPRA